MNPEAYFKLCEAHDWDYPMSDDRSVRERGQNEEAELRDTMLLYGSDSPEFEKFLLIYDAWQAHAREDGPKPQLSDFVPQNQTPLTGQKD